MELRLTIDRGNTALKVALWDTGGHLVCHSVRPAADDAAEAARALTHEGNTIASAIYCTVVASRRNADMASLQGLCTQLLDLTASTPMPLTLCYDTPATLGADRIAAAAGALGYACGHPALVADVGTAVTYDFVDADARYFGGNIAPGITMRLTALASHTAALPQVTADGPVPLWGTSTAAALRSGALRGVVAELEYYRHAAGPDAVTVLTGGSATLLANAGLINFDFIHDSCLVHRGLYSILRYNETH